MKNRLKLYFDAESEPPEHGYSEYSDLAKIVHVLNKTLSPHVRAKMVGNEAVIQCKNKTVWINSHCLVSGESSTQW
jgi:hypothetical protein